MKTYILRRQQTLGVNIEEAFRFFESAENLQKITPASVGFSMLTPLPVIMREGTVLDYVIRVVGLPVRWTTLITHYSPPYGFTDVALRGPYSFWHHSHTFEQKGDSTVMTDEIHYLLPFGPLGRLIRFLWVRRELNHIFDYRARRISELIKRGELPAPR